MKRLYLIISLLTGTCIAITCCNHISKETHDSLCPRNAYSRNCVDSVLTYSYSIKEGEVDYSSKQLISIERYDSLGNIVYYKGDSYPPALFDVFSECHYAIDDALDLPSGSIHSYKFHYTDTTLVNTAYFDEDGNYLALVNHFESPKFNADSVYVYSVLSFVRHLYKDNQERDSLDIRYDNLYSANLSLQSKEESSYESINDSTQRENYHLVSRYFGSAKKYWTVNDFVDRVFDNRGRLVQHHHGSNKHIMKYCDYGIVSDERISSDLGNAITKYEYDDCGLLVKEITYMDGTICSSYKEYTYTFYPYRK